MAASGSLARARRRRGIRRSTIALLLGLVGHAPAGAGERLEPPDLGRYARWGALRVRPRLELGRFGHDDNILARSSDEVSDLTATLSPTLDGLVLFGDRAFVEFTERVELTGYWSHPDQSFADLRGRGRVTFPLGRFGLFVDGRLDRVRERPVDLQDIRPRRREHGVGAGVIVKPGWRSELEIGRRVTGLEYADPDFVSSGQDIGERLDRRERRTFLEGDYLVAGRTRLTLDVDHGTTEFAASEPDGRSKDSADWSLRPGVDFGQGARLAGTARIGWAVVDAEEPTRSDLSRLVGDASLAYRPGRSATVRLEGWLRPGFSLYEDAAYLLERGLSLGALRYLGGPLGIEAGVTRGTLTFPGAGTSRVDRFEEYELGLRLRLSENDLGRRVEYSLEVEHERTGSSAPDQDRRRTAFGFGAVIGYGR